MLQVVLYHEALYLFHSCSSRSEILRTPHLQLLRHCLLDPQWMGSQVSTVRHSPFPWSKWALALPTPNQCEAEAHRSSAFSLPFLGGRARGLMLHSTSCRTELGGMVEGIEPQPTIEWGVLLKESGVLQVLEKVTHKQERQSPDVLALVATSKDPDASPPLSGQEVRVPAQGLPFVLPPQPGGSCGSS
jgi:hypothetical protein